MLLDKAKNDYSIDVNSFQTNLQDKQAQVIQRICQINPRVCLWKTWRTKYVHGRQGEETLTPRHALRVSCHCPALPLTAASENPLPPHSIFLVVRLSGYTYCEARGGKQAHKSQGCCLICQLSLLTCFNPFSTLHCVCTCVSIYMCIYKNL